MGGDGHDRAVAVVGQHVVGRPDRQALAVDGVDRVPLQEHARLGAIRALSLDLAGAAHVGQVVLEAKSHLCGGARRQLRGEIAVGRHHEERGAVERVGSGREDGDLLVVTLDLEVDVGADRTADPVALHPDDLLRPEALELVQVIQQTVGVVGDLEVPLRQLLLDDLGPAALAAAVDDLLVGQDRLVVGAPVDRALLAVGQAPLEEQLEQPLIPVVVLRIARVQDPRPVVGGAVLAEALLVLLDVRVGPLPRIGAPLDRGVLRGKAERVPADRIEHVVPAVAPESSDDVDVRVALRMTHVQVSRRVREHAEDVLARSRVAVSAGPERVRLRPARLPLLLNGVRVVPAGVCGHGGVGREGSGHGSGPIVEGSCRRGAQRPGYPTGALTSRAADLRRSPPADLGP